MYVVAKYLYLRYSVELKRLYFGETHAELPWQGCLSAIFVAHMAGLSTIRARSKDDGICGMSVGIETLLKAVGVLSIFRNLRQLCTIIHLCTCLL